MADTWYAIFDSGGHLVSTGTTVASDAELTAAGYSKVPLASDPTGQVWDPVSGRFVTPVPVLPAIPTWDFIARFVPSEYVAIEASTDPQVRMFLTMLYTTPQVRPGDTEITSGLTYLVSINLLTPSRAAAIGAQ